MPGGRKLGRVPSPTPAAGRGVLVVVERWAEAGPCAWQRLYPAGAGQLSGGQTGWESPFPNAGKPPAAEQLRYPSAGHAARIEGPHRPAAILGHDRCLCHDVVDDLE